MASAAFSIGGGASLARYTASSAQVVTIALDSVDGVRVSNVRVIATDETSVAANWVIASPTATSTTVTCPALAGVACILQWTVNAGTITDPTTGQTSVGDLVKTAKISIPTANGFHVICSGETVEHDRTYGWAAPVNDVIRNGTSGSSSAFDWKNSVRVATTANIALANEQTIDGVSVVAGNRVLVKNQTAGLENGIYVAAAGAVWARATDADTSAEVTSSMAVSVEEGTVNADTSWILTTNNPITLGTTALVFAAFGGGGAGLSDATPQAIGTAAAGNGTLASRDNHVHAITNATVLQAIDGESITPSDVTANNVEATVASFAAIYDQITGIQTSPMYRSTTVDLSTSQAWADVGAAIAATPSTALTYLLALSVQHDAQSSGELFIAAAHETKFVRVTVWRNGSNVAAFAHDGAMPWVVGDQTGSGDSGAQFQLVNAAGAWKVQVQKNAAALGWTLTAQVRVAIIPISHEVPWTTGVPTIDDLDEASLRAAGARLTATLDLNGQTVSDCAGVRGSSVDIGASATTNRQRHDASGVYHRVRSYDVAGNLACTDLYDDAATSRAAIGTHTLDSAGTNTLSVGGAVAVQAIPGSITYLQSAVGCSMNAPSVENRCTTFKVQNSSATADYWTITAALDKREWVQTGFLPRCERRLMYGTTTSAVATLLSGSFAAPASYDGVIRIVANVVSSEANGAAALGATLSSTYRVVAGTLTLIGSATTTAKHETSAHGTMYTDAGDNTIRVFVEGVDTDVERWHAYVNVYYGSEA